MLSIPYSDRDFKAIFEDIKEIIQVIEPRATVDFDSANVESTIAKIIAGCVDTLSYNQDANILEAFPSTARDPREVFDLLSIVGYTPQTARCCRVIMNLWNPSFSGEINYPAFSHISLDSKTFYNPDKFRCADGVTTTVEWYQGTLKAPEPKINKPEDSDSVIDNFYPNLSINVMQNNMYKLPENHINIDSRTIRIYTEDGRQLKFVRNPYLTNITKESFSIIPTVNSTGYSLIFSKDVSNGVVGNNFYYFYIISDGYDVGDALIPNFSGIAIGNNTPSFSYSYTVDKSQGPETASEARNNLAYEFGWNDTPKAIITKIDAERAVLQNFDAIAAVDVRDGDDYSFCSSNRFDVQIFCKVSETYEQILNLATADSLVNKLQTHFSKFKGLPLNYQFHIDNIQISDTENVSVLYYWYPNITIYLKEQVDAKEAAAIINSVNEALFERFKTYNMSFNEVPRIVDIIETVQNASETILYLDIDGVNYISSSGEPATKEDITCSFTQAIPTNEDPDNLEYEIDLNTKDNTRFIKYHSIKIVNNNNELIAFDNGDGTIIAYSTNYLDGQGTIDYETGKLKFKLLHPLSDNITLNITYKQETPTFCEYTVRGDSIKVALESLKP